MDALLAPDSFDVEAAGVAWVHSVAEALCSGLLVWAIVVALFLSVLTLLVVVRRRRVWCLQSQRDLDVDFQEFGLPGRRQPIAVLSCSAFSPPTRVLCDRACLHRQDWAPMESARET